MNNLRNRSRRERRKYQSASEWPDWTDDYRYAPSKADERLAAALLNDGEVPDEIYDQRAEESRVLDRLERGIRLF